MKQDQPTGLPRELMGKGMSRRDLLRYSAFGVGGVMAASSLAACADKKPTAAGPGGATPSASATPAQLKPFDPSAPAGSVPKLPKRLAYPNPYDNELFVVISKSMQMACEDRGLEYLTAINNGQADKQLTQTNTFFGKGIGALVETPYNPDASEASMKQALAQGALTVGIVRGTCHLQSSEGSNYKLGYNQATAAVKWVKENLGGNAEVAYFNEDTAESLIPRHKGALAALKEGGSGIKVVSDVSAPLDVEAGANAMTTILQAHPNIAVVLGGSGPIMGSYAAFKALGRAQDPKVYMSSIGPSNADFELIKQNTVYRATSGEPWPAWAYAFGQFAADWLEGKSIPRGITVPNFVQPFLGMDDVADFQDAMSDPRALWKDTARWNKYVAFYGNINYDQRDTYWTSVWDV